MTTDNQFERGLIAPMGFHFDSIVKTVLPLLAIKKGRSTHKWLAPNRCEREVWERPLAIDGTEESHPARGGKASAKTTQEYVPVASTNKS